MHSQIRNLCITLMVLMCGYLFSISGWLAFAMLITFLVSHAADRYVGPKGESNDSLKNG